MAGPSFFEKNKIDLDVGSRVTITITDAIATDKGQDFVDYMRNRNNDSGWATTGSTDAANTQIDIEFGESHEIDTLILLGINWKAYTIQYWNGSAYTNFSTPISETTNTDAEKKHSFNDVSTEKIRVIITGTMTVDDDKVCTQFIVTQAIGEFSAATQPWLADVTYGRNRRTVKMLSGKSKVQRSTGSVAFRLKRNNLAVHADLSLIETLHDYRHGFLVWPCGGTINQYDTERIFYRKQDIFLMAIASELQPEWVKGRFKNGMDIDVSFVEVV